MLVAYSTQTVISLLIACIPLLAAFVILSRKLFLQESMACLMAICIISFFKDILGAVSTLSPAGHALVENVFLLLNFCLILLACKSIVKTTYFHTLMPAIMLSVGAVFITYMLLTGPDQPQSGIRFAACLLILGISLYVLLKLMAVQQLTILKSPLFWTAAGFFFYHFQYLLIEVLGHQLFAGEKDFPFYAWIIMLLSKFVTYGFFLAASLLHLEKNLDAPRRTALG